MSAPQDGPTPDRVATPIVSTAPTSGTPGPPGPRWWHWDALPHHLGRARTSTVILCVLFVAVFTLYLYVRPGGQPSGSFPAGGSGGVEAPVVPVLPGVPAAPQRTEEPAPTTGAEPSEDSGGDTRTPTTGTAPASTTPAPSDPTAEPTGTSGPAGPTGDDSGTTTGAPSSSPAP